MRALEDFIKEYVPMPEVDLAHITKRFKCKVVKKDDYLLIPGNVCKDFIFVQSGCLRMYFIKGGIEISIWFAFADSVASEIHSFISEEPSRYFVQAIEDSELLFISKNQLNELYVTHPLMQEMMRKFWEGILIHIIDRFSSLQNDTAKERYLNLLNTPEYLQKIPQKYLASFIGITPTSLSRLRRQIT